MNWLGPLLGLIGGFSGIAGAKQGDPTKQLQALLMQLMSPQGALTDANKFYQGFLGSPSFAQGQGAIANSTNMLRNDLARSLGQRGLSTSGIGAVAGPLASSSAGFQMSNLYSAGWQQALQAALQQRAQLGGMLGGLGGGRNYGMDIFSGVLGALGPALYGYYSNRQQKPPTP